MADAPQNSSSRNSSDAAADPESVELQRATELLVAHLRGRGVMVQDTDHSDELASLMEAVEAFEAEVERRGGDLMVDEAPEGKEAQPDSPAFVLPSRSANESAADYAGRINSAVSDMGM